MHLIIKKNKNMKKRKNRHYFYISTLKIKENAFSPIFFKILKNFDYLYLNDNSICGRLKLRKWSHVQEEQKRVYLN